MLRRGLHNSHRAASLIAQRSGTEVMLVTSRETRRWIIPGHRRDEHPIVPQLAKLMKRPGSSAAYASGRSGGFLREASIDWVHHPMQGACIRPEGGAAEPKMAGKTRARVQVAVSIAGRENGQGTQPGEDHSAVGARCESLKTHRKPVIVFRHPTRPPLIAMKLRACTLVTFPPRVAILPQAA